MESRPDNLSAVIDALAREGDSPALVEITSQVRCHSRASLLTLVQRLAAGLRAADIGPGAVVALLAENRLEWIAAALAVIRAGAAVLPIDTQMGDTNLRHMLEDSGARLV